MGGEKGVRDREFKDEEEGGRRASDGGGDNAIEVLVGWEKSAL